MGRLGVSLAIGAASLAPATTAAAQSAREIDDVIIVTADPLELLELEDSNAVYGLSLSYAETPRSVSVISDALIDRFDIQTVNDLATVSPGAFTGSFFGVPGSVTLRGNRADTFWRGFRRAENPGTYPTPLGASERIEIVRGPTPALYGAGRVGGFINIVPLTARTRKDLGEEDALAEIGGTFGSYERRELDANLGSTFKLRGLNAGLYAHVEYENSSSFYRGIEPERTHAQLAFTLTDDDRFDVEGGGAFLSSNDFKQTIGWNRVTQDLIDSGVYITGRDTDLSDLNGDGKLTPDEVDAAVGSFFGTSNIRQLIDFGVFVSDAFALDEGIGVTSLSPRTVFVADQDIADAITATAYIDLAYRITPQSSLRLQGFYDSLDSDLYVSYGFAAEYVADVYELRASYETPLTIAGVSVETLLGASYRIYENETRQTFLSGYLAVDRRDLSLGPTGGDIFDDPFSAEPFGISWDTDLSSRTTDLGLFAIANAELTERLHAIASLRVDRFTASSINEGATIFDPSLGFERFEGTDWTPSYEFSLRYDLDSGLSPYVTYAENNALETNDGGGIEVDRIVQENFVADSDLFEGGVKFQRSDLTGSIAYYRQNRQRQDPFGNLDEEISRGVEAEAKYLLTDQWSLNAAVTWQETRITGPGPCGGGNGEFVVLPPGRVGLAPQDGFGGLFAALNASCLPELQNGYRRNTTPEWLASGFVSYSSPATRMGSFGATAGGVYAGETGGKIENAIVLPDYFLAQASLYYAYENVTLTAHVENLFDQRYFIPVQNVYEEVGVLPGPGRQFSLTLRVRF